MERPPVGQSRGRRGAKTTARTSESKQKGSKGEMPQPLSNCTTSCLCLPLAKPSRGPGAQVILSIGVSLLGHRAGQRNE